MDSDSQKSIPMSQANPESIALLGWRQGCILSRDMVTKLQENNEKKLPENISESDLLIVVTHDCNVVNRSFEAEPQVELLLARFLPIQNKNASLFWGRNPRRFQFLVQSELYEISVHDRFFIPRYTLLYNTPDTERSLTQDITKQICLWLSKRNYRVAFPDSFNNRIKRVEDAIRSKLKKTGQEITAIYISVSDEELHPDEVYEIDIRATMQCAAYNNHSLRQETQGIIDFIASKLNTCIGIEVSDNSVVSEAEVSIDDLRFLKRWDYDFLSYSVDTPDEIAPYP